MKRITIDRFTWENHCGTIGYSIFTLWDFDEHKAMDAFEVLK